MRGEMIRGATTTPPPKWPPPRTTPPLCTTPPDTRPPPPRCWACAGAATINENAATNARELRVFEPVMGDPRQAWQAGISILTLLGLEARGWRLEVEGLVDRGWVVADEPFGDQTGFRAAFALDGDLPGRLDPVGDVFDR